MSQGLAMYDAASRLVVHNERFLELYGLPPGAVRPGQTHREVVGRIAALDRYAAGPSTEEICAGIEALVERDAGPATRYRELADGRTLAIATRPMAAGGWVSTFEDVTERRRAEARISHMARHDALTGLPNRLFFHERLTRLLHPVGDDALPETDTDTGTAAAAAAVPSPCSGSTSTASRASTTPWGTPPATRC
jgi:hypothetical protein